MRQLLRSVLLFSFAFGILAVSGWLESQPLAMALASIFGLAAFVPIALLILLQLGKPRKPKGDNTDANLFSDED